MANQITVSTKDRDILYAIWELQDQFKIEEKLELAFSPEAKEILVVAKDGIELLAALIAIVQAVKTKNKKDNGSTSVSVQLGDNSANIIQFIESNKGSIDIKIENK